MSRLPDKPSELILAALEDLEKVKADPEYGAGSVMAMGLEEGASPAKSAGDTGGKLLALDAFRVGRVCDGIRSMGLPFHRDKWLLPRYTPDYHESPAAFKASMRELATELAAEGL